MADTQSGWWRGQSAKSDDGKQDQLLVFGYSCKLFRDDEKAASIDQGNHLIPWMGNDLLMIDRFDARGYLHDLHTFEHNSNSEAELTNEEKMVEPLCEEERYLALHKDLDEEAVHHEEELKRLRTALSEDSTAYNEVQFSYENDLENAEEIDEKRSEEEEASEEKPFVVPVQLNLPSNIFAPKTVKENAIIEKTAAFIATHGVQMEIVLKTKQSSNTQFQFLSFENPLNAYYKHVVESIRDGRYQPNIEDSVPDEEEEENDGSYLHPSLLAGSYNSPSQNNFMHYYAFNTQTSDSAYSQLVDKLKDKVVQYSLADTSQPNSQCQSPVNISPKQETFSSQAPIIPPEDMLEVIDKMAAYVAKNGESFEKTVLGKGDSRFDFLKPSHKYNSYYKQRCKHHMLTAMPSSKVVNHEKKSKKSVKAPVSFAIKSKDGDGATLDKNVLSGDESDSVTCEQNSSNSTDTAETTNIQSVTQSECEKSAVELKQVQPQERLKDKIAAAARERMSQITKEKMLQLERRRKAALFLNMIKNSGISVESSKKATGLACESKDEDSLVPTSAITSPLNSPQSSPFRSKGSDGKEKDQNTFLSSMRSRTKSSNGRSYSKDKRSESRSKSSSKKYRRSRSRSRSRSRRHGHKHSFDSSRSKSHSKSKRRSKRSRSPIDYRHSKSSRRRHHSSDSS